MKSPFTVGPWRIEPGARTATDGNRTRHLSPRAIDVLTVLADADGDAVSRQTLIHRVWPHVTVGDDSLTQAIAELRRALGCSQGENRLIQTIHKRGYRLCAPVTHDAHERAPTDEGFDLTAYLLVTQAREVMIRSGPEAIEMAEALATEACAHSPSYALARAERAIAMANQALYRGAPRARLVDALAEAEMAQICRPDLSSTNAALGFVLGALGEFGRARDAFSRAFQRDPGDGEAHYLAARTFLVARDYRAATLLAERAGTLCNDGSRSLFIGARAARALDAHTSARVTTRCRARLRAILNEEGSGPRFRHALPTVLAFSGDLAGARRASEDAARAGSPLRYYAVLANTLLGDMDGALVELQEAVDSGWRDGAYLRAEPALAPLAREPRFQALANSLP